MSRRPGRPISRWLAGGDKRLPRHLRVPLFALALAALGASYAATGSEGVQLLVLFAFVFGVLPAATLAFGRADGYLEATKGRDPPIGVFAVSLLFLVPWGAVVLVVVPDLGLGPWFWPGVVLWPWLEVYVYLAEGSLRRDGAASWRPVRPLRDSAVAGGATVPMVVGIVLLDGFDLGEALLTGFLCGLIVFSMSLLFVWLWRRAEDAPRRS